MTENVKFLCGNYKGINLIYGIRFSDYCWNYFDEQDSHASEHTLLPERVHNLIGTLEKPKSIEVPLSDDQLKCYFTDGKFIFKNKELISRLPLVDKNLPHKPDNKSSKGKTTDNLAFICGQTNPLLFVSEFEKCSDVKTDKDKMFKLRKFVNDSHRVEFSELYFVSDWPTMRLAFVKKYSWQFMVEKKRELNVSFGDEISVRCFVERKLQALSAYTTLPFINQMEIVLNEMPVEISNLFLINDMMTGPQTKILEFCDSIQEMASTMSEKTEEPHQVNHKPMNAMNPIELYHFDPDQDSSDQQSVASSQSASRRRGGRGRGGRGSGGRRRGNRFSVELRTDLTGESSYSQSTDQNESEPVDSSPQSRIKTRQGISSSRITKRGRETSPKKLKTIEENSFSEDMDTD